MSAYDNYIELYTAKICVDIGDAQTGSSYVTGSGLLISPSYVVTVKHVLHTEKRRVDSDIEIYLYEAISKNERFEKEFVVSDIIDFTDSDVVFLKLKDPAPVDVSKIPFELARDMVTSFKQKAWTASGYPSYTKEDIKDLKVFRGNLSSSATNTPLVDATSELLLKELSNWKGVSGAALTIDQYIVGVLEETNTNEDNAFRVYSIPYLFNSIESTEKFSLFYNDYLNSLGSDDINREKSIVKRVVAHQIEVEMGNNSAIEKELYKLLPNSKNFDRSQVGFKLCDFWDSQTAMDDLYKMLDSLNSNTFPVQNWNNLVDSAYNIASWFLLLSLRDSWREICEFEFDKIKAKDISLIERPFIEVLISRGLLRKPEFEFNDAGKAEDLIENFSVYDSDESSFNKSVLIRLYKVFVDGTPDPNETNEKLMEDIADYIEEDIESRQRIAFRNNHPVPPSFLYYLVDSKSYDLLAKNKFINLSDRLNSRIKFIGVSAGSENISQFVDKKLLIQLRKILKQKK